MESHERRRIGKSPRRMAKFMVVIAGAMAITFTWNVLMLS
jgi:hypothetical protein